MSYSDLINIKYKSNVFLIFIITTIIISLVIISNIRVTDVYNTYTYYEDNYFILKIPIDTPDTINKLEYIKINNEKYDVKDYFGGELSFENNVNYQEYKLLVEGSFKENIIYKISIYHSSEKIKEKVLNIIIN